MECFIWTEYTIFAINIIPTVLNGVICIGGHATSKDLIHWKEENPSIARDTLGHIFSGSAVIDKNNTAGYGKNAIIALYTSASDKNGQIECMAYSTDKGYTYTKYDKNPV